jgi:pimeloyl-ACP methyl ester carboxylesterase
MHASTLPSVTLRHINWTHRLGKALLAGLALTGLFSCAPSRPAANPTISPQSTPKATFVAALPASGKVVTLQDIDVYYEEYGEGEPVLLLHGGMGCNEDWANQIGPFSALYRIVAPDSRGQGRTTDGDGPLTYHLMAEDALRLMDYLDIQTAFIVGYSDGAIVALDIAMNHPDRVRAIVAYAANLTPEDVTTSALDFTRDSSPVDFQAALSQPYTLVSPQPEHLPVIAEKIRTLWLTEPNFTSDQLARISVPVLVIDGENEEVIRAGHAAEIAAAIPGAKLVILPAVGHYALSQSPAAWNEAVLDFLAAQ